MRKLPVRPRPPKTSNIHQVVPFAHSTWQNMMMSSSSSYDIASSENVSRNNLQKSTAQLGAWIPVGSASAFAPLSPTMVTIMNQEFAVWQNELTKEWSVLLDECPHRLAPLSQGRINPSSGCIECPYHGWEFECDGTNHHIPQFPNKELFDNAISNPKSNLHATSFPVHLSGDLIFAFLPTPFHNESFPITLTPEEMYFGLSAQASNNMTFYVRELPYSFDFLVENFFCPAHIPFAHHGLQGVRNDGSPIPMNVIANNFTTVEVEYQDRIRNKTRNGILSFARPSYYHFRLKDLENKIRKTPALQIYCVPIRAGQSRVLFQNAFSKRIPTWLVHAASNRFLNTDTWLHNAERRMRIRQDNSNITTRSTYTSPTSSDLGVLAFRNWWSTYGMSLAPPHSFGPATTEQLPSRSLTRSEQIDPWVHHTKHCASCRKALKLWKRSEKLSLAFSFASVAFLGVTTHSKQSYLMTVLLSLLGLGAHFLSKSACTFIEGNPYPSGIADRSVAATKEDDKSTAKM
eukprot:CAMPEP_0172430208 /NCGR_PEP_ID=MMETSP1064-20121228/53576_1 /TAXON_ID=202472 /ORGANISM="Aulacoseira subarctica , Strain CCAP 1002/5" /LENGTH=516 /DNA_ID=CAMNT_0013176115 /DNA_START=89 /DNA_END=1636 /DNA_ORIENTATION=-